MRYQITVTAIENKTEEEMEETRRMNGGYRGIDNNQFPPLIYSDEKARTALISDLTQEQWDCVRLAITKEI